VDCTAVESLVQGIEPQKVEAADTTLVGAVGACPQAEASARQLIDAGLKAQAIAPRATMALMEQAGLRSAWSQEKFEELFAELPSDAGRLEHEAPNLAAIYARASGNVDADAAAKAGVRLLLWLAKLDEGGDRSVAIHVTTAAMRQALGEKGYDDALAGDVMARQAAASATATAEVSQPLDAPVSVLAAMQAAHEDRLRELEELPASERARQAAASGFAAGTAGEKKLAARYFDLAFGSVNEMWSERASVRDAVSIVRQVAEAAAQADAVDALRRAQGLDDSAAEAIGMIAVARVVASQQTVKGQ
jgi:hypothetical protein